MGEFKTLIPLLLAGILLSVSAQPPLPEQGIQQAPGNPSATLSVDKTTACIGESISITVDGQDDEGVRSIYYWHGRKVGQSWIGRWERYSCEGMPTSCSHTWTRFESRAGTVYYFGYVLDNDLNGAWSTPKFVRVEVIECGTTTTTSSTTTSTPSTTTTIESLKNPDKFSEKQAFLISDENWGDILSLVPVTTWTTSTDSEDWEWCNQLPDLEKGVCSYPLLTYHRESDYVSHSESIVSIDHGQVYPAISEDRIVWVDIFNDLYLYELSTGKETQIVTTSFYYKPAVSGDIILWTDYRNGNSDIYLYDLSVDSDSDGIPNYLDEDRPDPDPAEVQVTMDTSDQLDPAISGEIIVWEDYRNGNYDIYMYDLSVDSDGDGIPNYLDDDRPHPDPAERQITTDSNQFNPAVSGDRMVWDDYRNGNADVYLCDLTLNDNPGGCLADDEKTQVTKNTSHEYHQAISGDRIVWVDKGERSVDLYVCDLSLNDNDGGCLADDEKMLVSKDVSYSLAVSGDKIVWEDNRNGNGDIYICDLSLNGNRGGCLADDEKTQATNDPYDQYYPAISEDTIIWVDEIYHGTGNPAICTYSEDGITAHHDSFDVDSIIYFMQQYALDSVTLIGETPLELDDLLIAPPPLGAGLTDDQISRKYPSDYLSYWDQIEYIVYVVDSYGLGLMASTYASLINAPLIVEGDINKELSFADKDVILVGDVPCPSNARSCTPSLGMLDLQQVYVDITDTDRIILTNPDDLDISVRQFFEPEKSMENFDLYTKTSLGAPVLASAKHELIIPVRSTDYREIDSELKSKINQFFPDLLEREGAIEREGDEFISIYMHDLSTGGGGWVTYDSYKQYDLGISGDRIVWRDNRNGNYDVYLCDLSLNGNDGGCLAGDEKTQVTRDISDQYYPLISGEIIVWSDKRNGNYDIYICDLTLNGNDGGCLAGDEKTQVTNNSYDQYYPAISGDIILWTHIMGENYDIHMCDLTLNGHDGGCLAGDEKMQVTADEPLQASPAISGDRIIWLEVKKGDSHSDIYLCDLSLNGHDGGCLAGDEKIPVVNGSDDPYYTPYYPAISGDIIVWYECSQ